MCRPNIFPRIYVVWDLGATNARVWVIEITGNPGDEEWKVIAKASTKVVDHSSVCELIDELESQLGRKMKESDGICIAGAGVWDEVAGELKLEPPYKYQMTFGREAENREWPELAVINDYTSVFFSTASPYIGMGGSYIHRTGRPDLHKRRVTFGFGSGFGLVDGVKVPGYGMMPLDSEFGHIGLPVPCIVTADDRFHRTLTFLQEQDFGTAAKPLTIERVTTGPGSALLHQMLTSNVITPEELGKMINGGQAEDTLAFLSYWIGLAVGTIEVALWPTGGMYITGGVIIKHRQILTHPAFEDGRTAVTDYLDQRTAELPFHFLDHAAPFYGAAKFMLQRQEHAEQPPA